MFQFESQGAVDLIAPTVAINHETAAELLESVTEKTFDGQPMVVLDMSEVPLVDSAGLEAILDTQEVIRETSGTLKLAGLTPLCTDVLRITGLDQRFEIYEDSKQAVRSFVR